ncbi:hypothetical protein [Streptomyces sioyaensis]|uniref:hypothetical protein n=1 Tax=Streptomyces sioyaensis TaxID=67364 RepID=UPI0037A36B1B
MDGNKLTYFPDGIEPPVFVAHDLTANSMTVNPAPAAAGPKGCWFEVVQQARPRQG